MPQRSLAADIVPLSGPSVSPAQIVRADQLEAVAQWQTLVDARLIGTVQPRSDETLANIAANEAALGVRRRGRMP